jgi:large subunit ribosomal protein L3
MQIGFGKRKRSRLKRPEKGHFSKAKVDPCSRLQEVRCVGKPEQVIGDLLTVANFQEGQKVDIVGESKGKGFQGVVKRWGFKGGPRSHGSMFHRRGGSYGQCQWPGEVYKGRKMPGRMGNVRRTVQNLRIIKILADKNLILVRGSIPGANGAKVLVRTAKKTQKSA